MKKIYFLLLLMLSLTINAQYVVDFEDGSKGSYATGTVTLNGIDWDMTDALIGTAVNDFFNGTKSARLRGYGTSSISMLADKSNGLGQISFQYRAYGTDAQVSWKVEYSTNAGGAWAQAGPIFTGTASVQTFVATVNVTGNARIRIVRDTNDAATANKRLNVDDITLQDFTGTTMPSLTITSPANATLFDPFTTSVNIDLNIANFTVANGTGDGHIHYTVSINGGTASTPIMKYDTTPINLPVAAGNSYTLNLYLVDNSHINLIPSVTATITFQVTTTTAVTDINDLRTNYNADPATGATKYYEITVTDPIITYSRSTRNQKYIEDSSAAILIDDNSGIMPFSGGPVTGDALRGLIGRVSEFNGVLQITPYQAATVSSSGNVVTPQVVTAADITANIEMYESELVRINSATFTTADGTTVTYTENTSFNINDGASDIAFRTMFAEANYIGQIVPTGAANRVVLVAEFNGTAQVVARNLADVTLSTNSFDAIEGLTMYPNPLSGNTLNFTSAINAEMNVQIFDILGKQISTSKVNNNTLNVSNLNAGIYIVKITEEGKTATRKLVVK